MAEKVTFMKLKVDLECEKCYKKVKKVLAKFPQIRDQKFDEKQNIVSITVVCCSPEKIRDKLCKKGGGSIKSIEIVEPKPPEKKKDEPKPEKTKEPEKKKDEPKPEKTKEPEKKKEEPKPEKTKEPEKKPEKTKEPEKKKDEPKPEKTKEPEKKKDEPKPDPPPAKLPDPVPVYPPVPPPMAVPVGICCGPCYEGRPGGPCVGGYVGPPVCYDGYYGRPVYDSYAGGRPYYYVSRCDQYFSEDNASGCTIM